MSLYIPDSSNEQNFRWTIEPDMDNTGLIVMRLWFIQHDPLKYLLVSARALEMEKALVWVMTLTDIFTYERDRRGCGLTRPQMMDMEADHALTVEGWKVQVTSGI